MAERKELVQAAEGRCVNFLWHLDEQDEIISISVFLFCILAWRAAMSINAGKLFSISGQDGGCSINS